MVDGVSAPRCARNGLSYHSEFNAEISRLFLLRTAADRLDGFFRICEPDGVSHRSVWLQGDSWFLAKAVDRYLRGAVGRCFFCGKFRVAHSWPLDGGIELASYGRNRSPASALGGRPVAGQPVIDGPGLGSYELSSSQSDKMLALDQPRNDFRGLYRNR